MDPGAVRSPGVARCVAEPDRPHARRGIDRVVHPGLRHLSQRRAVGAPVPAGRRVRLAAARPWLGVARHPGRGDHDLCQWSGRRRGTADGGHRDRGVRPVVVPGSDGRRRRDPGAPGRGPAAAAHRRRGPGRTRSAGGSDRRCHAGRGSRCGTRRRHRPGCSGHPDIGGAAARCHDGRPARRGHHRRPCRRPRTGAGDRVGRPDIPRRDPCSRFGYLGRHDRSSDRSVRHAPIPPARRRPPSSARASSWLGSRTIREPSPTRRCVRPSRPRSSCPRTTSVCARTSRPSWPSWRRPAGAWSTPVCARARRWVDRSTATCSSGSPPWSDAWRRSRRRRRPMAVPPASPARSPRSRLHASRSATSRGGWRQRRWPRAASQMPFAYLAVRSSVDVDLDVPPGVTGGPGPDATVYFVCAEALANVARHARASHVRIVVEATETAISVVVADDGVGGADPGPRVRSAGTGGPRGGDGWDAEGRVRAGHGHAPRGDHPDRSRGARRPPDSGQSRHSTLVHGPPKMTSEPARSYSRPVNTSTNLITSCVLVQRPPEVEPFRRMVGALEPDPIVAQGECQVADLLARAVVVVELPASRRSPVSRSVHVPELLPASNAFRPRASSSSSRPTVDRYTPSGMKACLGGPCSTGTSEAVALDRRRTCDRPGAGRDRWP